MPSNAPIEIRHAAAQKSAFTSAIISIFIGEINPVIIALYQNP